MKITGPAARLGASLAVALIAGGATWRALVQARQSAGAGPVVPVLVARHAVATARSLSAADVDVRSIPAAFAENGAFHDPKELAAVRARVPIAKGEFVTRSKIESESSRLGLAWSLPAGQTAVSLRLAAEEAVGGHVLPGDWVRVIGSSRSSTEIVIERARVVAVRDRLWEPGGAPPSPLSDAVANESVSVTLMFTAEQAVRTVSAAERGRLTLALLSPIDEAPAEDGDDR